MDKLKTAYEKRKSTWKNYTSHNLTTIFTILEALISFIIMILWGAVRYPTGMTVRRERVLFNHTSTAFSLTAGGIVFDQMMGNETPLQLQLVYSVLGFVLYGLVLMIQLLNFHVFDKKKMTIMIILHVFAVIIFLLTTLTIFISKSRPKPGPSSSVTKETQTKLRSKDKGMGPDGLWMFDKDTVEEVMIHIKKSQEGVKSNEMGEESSSDAKKAQNVKTNQDQTPGGSTTPAEVTQNITPNKEEIPSGSTDAQDSEINTTKNSKPRKRKVRIDDNPALENVSSKSVDEKDEGHASSKNDNDKSADEKDEEHASSKNDNDKSAE